MKKIFASLFVCLAALGMAASAAEPAVPVVGGIFNHLSVSAGVGLNGIGFEAATPVTRFLALRAGVHVMPNFKYSTSVDANYTYNGISQSKEIDVDCGIGRTQGSVLLNIYPIPTSTFFIAAGAYFSGDKIIKITGHNEELANGSIEIGDYNLPVDSKGNVRGGLKAKGFRPYLGIGWGRAIPKRLLSFSFELGAQFEGKPKVYSETGDLQELADKADNNFNDYIKYLKVYPNLTFRLAGKIF